MSDDTWRRDRRDDDDDFGPPLFGDETPSAIERTAGDRSGGAPRPPADEPVETLSFGDADTGPLPHWTEPATGEIPRIAPVSEPESASGDEDWSPFGGNVVWSDDPAPDVDYDAPTRPARRPGSTSNTASTNSTASTAGTDAIGEPVVDPTGEVGIDPTGEVATPRGPGRITIGTDPTGDRLSRPSGSRGRARPERAVTRSRPDAAPPSGRDLPTAVAVGLLLIAAFVAALFVGAWAVMVIVVAIIGLAAIEFYDKVTESGYRPATVAGIVTAVALPLAAYWVGERGLVFVVMLSFVAMAVTFISAPNLESGPLPNLSMSVLATTWIGLAGGYAALIVGWSNTTLSSADGPITSVGTDTLFLIALGVVANDVGALFIGSAAGRTPLRAWISPNKTVEGFVGGAVMTLLAMVVVGVADRSSTWNSIGDLIILGIVVSITAPLGDLIESMFKRNLDIKDFGTIVPGHGGVLDRFDGFLVTLPAVYYLLELLEPWVTA